VLPVGAPTVSERGDSELVVACPVEGLGTLSITCREGSAEFRVEGEGEAAAWALSMDWADGASPPITRTDPGQASFTHSDFAYQVACVQGHLEDCGERDSIIEAGRIVIAPEAGAVVLDFTAR